MAVVFRNDRAVTRYSLLFMMVFSFVFLSGCFRPFHKTSVPPAVSVPQVSVQVLSEEALVKGGDIVFVPFVAGSGAEAGAEVDRIALLIVQGAAEALEANSSVLRIVSGEESSRASFILDGRIEDYNAKIAWKGLGMGLAQIVLKVKGELRDQATGEVLAFIFGSRIVKRQKDVDEAAYDIGRVIGEELSQ